MVDEVGNNKDLLLALMWESRCRDMLSILVNLALQVGSLQVKDFFCRWERMCRLGKWNILGDLPRLKIIVNARLNQ